MSVASISATSISLSWSVPSDSLVISSQVIWQVVDSSSGAFGSSGSLTDTSYTIEGLVTTTIYNITVIVTNTAGSTESQPIIVSTGTEGASSTADNTAAIIGGVVAVVLILSITTAVTIIILVRNRRGSYSTRKRLAVYHYHYMYVDYYTVHTERLFPLI